MALSSQLDKGVYIHLHSVSFVWIKNVQPCGMYWESKWMLSVSIREHREIERYVKSWFVCYFWYFDKWLLVLYMLQSNVVIYVFYVDEFFSFLPLLSQNQIKNAECWGCFQGLTQFSHCFGLKWVRATKAACIWAELKQSEGCWSQINFRRDYRGWRDNTWWPVMERTSLPAFSPCTLIVAMLGNDPNLWKSSTSVSEATACANTSRSSKCKLNYWYLLAADIRVTIISFLGQCPAVWLKCNSKVKDLLFNFFLIQTSTGVILMLFILLYNIFIRLRWISTNIKGKQIVLLSNCSL